MDDKTVNLNMVASERMKIGGTEHSGVPFNSFRLLKLSRKAQTKYTAVYMAATFFWQLSYFILGLTFRIVYYQENWRQVLSDRSWCLPAKLKQIFIYKKSGTIQNSNNQSLIMK